jgi:arabinofuranosyltransferase
VVGLLGLAFRRAWVGEDAFITFRTIEHFVHGEGLRWNIDERVQSYTHPLWLFVNVPVYIVIRDVCTAVTAAALAASAGTFALLAARFRRRPGVLLLGSFLPLAASRSFVQYSTSGFENSLSHLCYTAFALLLLRVPDRGETPWGRLALTAALGMTNRLDTALFYAPPLLALTLLRRREIRWARFLLGFSPILAWSLFSTFYYGFPYPNTALAKISGAIPRGALADYGLTYALHLLVFDPIGFLAIVAGGAITLVRLWSARSPEKRSASLASASLGLGSLLYCAYVVSIGGCYLGGRFWSLPILASVLLWSAELEKLAGRFALRRSAWLGAVGGAVVVVAVVAGAPRLRPAVWARPHRVLPMDVAYKYLDGFTWQASQLAERFERGGERRRIEGATVVSGAIGMSGFTAGREVILVDRIGLADALLARLPPKPPPQPWDSSHLMGHFRREVPEGYVHARETGSLEEMDPEIREYYRPLRSIISDPLLSWKRLRTIVTFNFGRYDRHRDAFLEANPPEIRVPKKERRELEDAEESGVSEMELQEPGSGVSTAYFERIRA